MAGSVRAESQRGRPLPRGRGPGRPAPRDPEPAHPELGHDELGHDELGDHELGDHELGQDELGGREPRGPVGRGLVPRGPVLRDPVLLGLAGLALLTAGWFLLGPGGSTAYWLEQVALDIGVALLSLRVAQRALSRPIRRFWRAMGVAGGFFSAADGYQTVVVLLHPGAQIALLQPVLVATGVASVVVIMLTYPMNAVGRERLRLWLDASTMMIAVAVFIWYFVIGGQVGQHHASSLAASSIASLVMLLSAFGILKLLLSGNAPFTRTAGICGMVAVTGLGLNIGLQSEFTGRLVWITQLLPCILFTALPRIQEVQMAAWSTDRGPRARRSYSRMPYVAVLAAQTLLIVGLAELGLDARTWGVALGVVAITIVVLSRQLIAFHDNAQLLVSLDASVTEARALEEQLRHKATHDPLTRLANRALFDERIQVAQQARGDWAGEVGLLVIDLDDFKQINDTLGHHVGDALLVAVAERLRLCVRHRDTVARLGGDEFAVLLAEAPPGRARLVAKRMVEALAEPVLADGHWLPMRASIGVATGTVARADSLLRDADAAMYLAKQNGKGGYRLAQPVLAGPGGVDGLVGGPGAAFDSVGS